MTQTIFDFSGYIAERTRNFTGRQWVFDEIETWLANTDAPRYFIITGEPGIGKTAIAARLTQIRDFAAIHFCRARDANTIDPLSFTRSISGQLRSIDDFAKGILEEMGIHLEVHINIQENYGQVIGQKIENIIGESKSATLAFNRTVLEPLKKLYEEGFTKQLVILVDALDEAVQLSGSDNIVDLIANTKGFPSQVRFILTSRPERNVLRHFEKQDLPYFVLNARREENQHDVAEYIHGRLEVSKSLQSRLVEQKMQPQAFIDQVTTASQSNFLYLVWLLPVIEEGVQRFDSLEALPKGLDGIYREFLRTRTVGKDIDKWHIYYLPILGVLAAAQAPLKAEQLVQFVGISKQDVVYYLFYLQQFLDPVLSEQKQYRLYHQSVTDFLFDEEKAEEFWIDPVEVHKRIISFYQNKALSFEEIDWSVADHYALRHLVAHLYQLRHDKEYLKMLHTLLETRSFIDQYLKILGKPYLLLEDLRLALNLALENDDLAQAWRHIREFRRVVRDQLDFEQLLTAVETANKNGDYDHVKERTTLYGYMPNSQALARLWIAWNAAASGHSTVAGSIVNGTLEKLPPRGMANFATSRAGSLATQAVEDVIGETLQRMLIRISQAATNAEVSDRDWLKHAMSPWPTSTVDVTVGRLSESLTLWGRIFGAEQMSDTMELLFDQLQAIGGRINADMFVDKYTMYFFQSRLAAGLFNSRQDPAWLEHVKRSVALIAQDDYPSYREVALSWIAAATLAQEDTVLASKALAVVLGGMFKPSPGFWGDTVAAAMEGMERENNQRKDCKDLLNLLEHVEATGERGIDPSVPRKMPDIMLWRRSVGLPEDPWSFSMRRRSAVAAVLHRRGDDLDSKTLLQKAIAESPKGSYAGYRALARLSLACRLFEWRSLSEAISQTERAKTDALNVRDDVLREERFDLVNKMCRWIKNCEQNSIYLSEDEALAQLQRKTGLERGLFIEFLSALWSDNASSLKRLLPLSLDDATTADAVLGRLLEVESLQAKPGRPFLELVKALQIDTGIEM